MTLKVKKKFWKSTIKNKLSKLAFLDSVVEEGIADLLFQINKVILVMPILVTKFIFSTHLLAAETKQNEEVIMIKTMNIRICILHFKDIVLRDPMEQEDSTL